MFTNILIPTDFSPASYKATQIGIELSKQWKAVVSILHVYPVISKYSKEEESEIEEMLEAMKVKMNELTKNMIGPETRVNNVVLPGNVGETMIRFIDDNQFDLVIVGVNSNGGDDSVGSHTASLIERSGTPIMIVPNSYGKDGTA